MQILDEHGCLVPTEELPNDLAGQPEVEPQPVPVVEEPKKRRRKAAA